MSFMWPTMLFSLLLVPVFAVLYFRTQRRRRWLAASYGGSGLGQRLSGRQGGFRRHMPAWIFLVGLTLLLFSLARPQAVLSLPRTEGTVILAFDVSQSMAADDLQPTRLDAAKAAALAFVEHQPSSVLVGVVAFSDNGFMVQTPTSDQADLLNTINRLTPDLGTSLANGIFASLNAIAPVNPEPAARLYSDLTPVPTPTPTPMQPGTVAPDVIVLLTDGENNESPDPLEAAQAAADQGVRIYTVGIGSATGTTLHLDGFSVYTQLDEAMLQDISQLTGGTYYNAENEQELRTIYENLDPQLVIKREELEVTSVFAGVSILTLLTGGALSLLWFSRLP